MSHHAHPTTCIFTLVRYLFRYLPSFKITYVFCKYLLTYLLSFCSLNTVLHSRILSFTKSVLSVYSWIGIWCFVLRLNTKLTSYRFSFRFCIVLNWNYSLCTILSKCLFFLIAVYIRFILHGFQSLPSLSLGRNGFSWLHFRCISEIITLSKLNVEFYRYFRTARRGCKST